jgi:hypothetical protein
VSAVALGLPRMLDDRILSDIRRLRPKAGRSERMLEYSTAEGAGLHELSSRRRWAIRGCVLLAVLCGGLARSVQAQQAPPPAVVTPPAPSPSHVALARALVVATGISRSFAILIPQYMDQISKHVIQTRPELNKDLELVMTELKPEFDRQADEMVDIAAQVYAKHIPETDLQAAVAFFTSSSGRKYVAVQPAILTEVVTAMQGWQGKISTDMMTRVRAEMKKKGHEL